jgi:cell division protein FtsB
MTEDPFQTLSAELAQVRRQGERTEQTVQALQHDMAQMRDHLDGSLVEVRQEIVQTRADLRQEIAETRDELRTEIVDLHRHFDVVTEDLRGQIQLIAEGLVGLGERMEERMAAGRRETAAELSEIKALIRFCFTDLDRRVTRLEGTL